MATHLHQLPSTKAVEALSIDELLATTLRLSDVLAEESEMLQGMKLKEMPKFHEEKQKLTKTLETYQQVLATNPDFIRGVDEKKRKELLLLTDDLAFNVEENFRHTSVARAVNQRVMQAITEVLTEQHSPGTYGSRGQANQSGDLALSFNLNQQA